MMHGQEKSDPSIRAMKLTNNGGQPSAESMEQREGAKGNTGEHHTCRTLSRESVFQGLPAPRILHPWPDVRFFVKHPRWEPGARIAPAGICAGGTL
jgi:hypothetical protein